MPGGRAKLRGRFRSGSTTCTSSNSSAGLPGDPIAVLQQQPGDAGADRAESDNGDFGGRFHRRYVRAWASSAVRADPVGYGTAGCAGCRQAAIVTHGQGCCGMPRQKRHTPVRYRSCGPNALALMPSHFARGGLHDALEPNALDFFQAASWKRPARRATRARCRRSSATTRPRSPTRCAPTCTAT